MKILLVSATPFEIAPTLAMLEQDFKQQEGPVFIKNEISVRPLITGVGVPATTWHMGQALQQNKPDWVLNAGVAGAFDRKLPLGIVTQVKADQFGDLGVEEADGRFTTVFELGLTATNEPPYVNGTLYNPKADEHRFLPTVNGLTVNCVHGHSKTIEAIQEKYPEAQIETMEGAAFFYACLLSGVPFLAIRSISNYVEPRNRDAWELGLAIESLNAVLIEMLQQLTAPPPPP